MVTHPSTNRAQRRLTLLIDTNDVTITPHHHDLSTASSLINWEQQQPFYSYYAGQPVLYGTPVMSLRIFLEQSLTGNMSLLTVTSALFNGEDAQQQQTSTMMSWCNL